MTQKFERFKAALIALCEEHDVTLSASGYEHLQVWDRDTAPTKEALIYPDNDLEDNTQ